MSNGSTTAQVQWADATHSGVLRARCPLCGDTQPKRLRLTVRLGAELTHGGQWRVLDCPGCTCSFYEDQNPPDYTAREMLDRGRVPFYLQQGAGLSLITRPLARLLIPPGASYLEVGCGFGFGVDYATRAKRWTAQGLDPGAIAGLGSDALGVRIDQRYLRDDEPELVGRFDVVMASETIEHVRAPAEFVRTLRALLRDGGTLVLTTPDVADLTACQPPGVLIPLLSPGLHLTLLSTQTLHRLLEESGFAYIEIDKDGHSLVALASDAPLRLETDTVKVRAEYFAYLAARAASVAEGSDLFFAFAGRAFQEAVNAAQFDEARPIRRRLDRACLQRFGHSLDGLGASLAAFAGATLEQLIELMPLCLAGLLYADAILRLRDGVPRPNLVASFERAAQAADVLRDAMSALSMEDGMSEDISWTASAEALLCAAAGGDPAVPHRLAVLPDAPRGGAGRRWEIAARTLVELVNASHYMLATAVAEQAGLSRAIWALPAFPPNLPVEQRDALFCLGVLNLQNDGTDELELGLSRFQHLRQLLRPAERSGLYAAATTGARLALERLGRHSEAARL